jgi:hypothetical protein
MIALAIALDGNGASHHNEASAKRSSRMVSENAASNVQHKDLVRDEFTRQANDYAAAPAIRDIDHIEKLVKAVSPSPDARVLEIATGPGHVAMAFARSDRRRSHGSTAKNRRADAPRARA